jgi:hypothetical protein
MIKWFKKLFISDEPDKVYHTLRHTTIMLFLLLGFFPHTFSVWYLILCLLISQLVGWIWEKIDKWRGVGWSWGDIWANTIGDGFATFVWLSLLFVKWIL